MVLEREGHRVLTADSGPEALTVFDREPVQVVLVDYFMPAMDGEELVELIRQRDALVQIVLQTGYADQKPPREMLSRLAIQACHDKSEGTTRLLLWIDSAIKAYDQLGQLAIAERMKAELLANVSHEFRTPLNIISGYIDLLREGTFGACPPSAAVVFEKVVANCSHLLELVDEFHDLSKLEAGTMRIRREVVELTPFLRELGESFARLVRTKPVDFDVDIPEHLPAIVTEGAKLRVIIHNLLSNAAKYTKEGEIGLTASILDDGRIGIQVRDTGAGIPAEHQDVIFDMLQQLGPMQSGGKTAGLGLALARRFARMMNGDITVESAVGRGSTFTLLLPPAASPAATLRETTVRP